MENLLTLVKCITLRYRESTQQESDIDSSEIVRAALSQVKAADTTLTLDDTGNVLNSLRVTALSLCDNKEIDKNDLLLRLKVNCSNNERIYSMLQEGIVPDLDEVATRRMIASLRKGLKESSREKQVLDILHKAHTDTTYRRGSIRSIKNYVAQLMGQLEPFRADGSEDKDPAMVGEIDLANPDSLKSVMDEMQSVENNHGILRTGWQGLNEALQGGFRPGDEWVIPALQHRWKTGFTLSLFRQIATYNTPVLLDPTKKPLLLRISFEDNLPTNVRFLYESICFNETGNMPDIRQIPVGDMANIITQAMEKNGFHIKLWRVNASAWTFNDLQNAIINLETQGYEIKMCMIDALYSLPTTGMQDGPHGTGLNDLFHRARNFFSARKAVLITPHQLSTDAKMLIREGTADFVKRVCGNGYYKGSKQIDQEVDGEIYIHIEKSGGKSYLTVLVGKHRGVPVIHEDKKYLVYPFPDVGPIPDDVDKPRIDVKRVGALSHDEQEAPFFAF